MTKLDLLISTMKQAMKQYDEEAKKIMDENDSSFGKYKKYLTLLEEDINNITDMTQEELAEILSEIDLSEEDRETEIDYLRSVISLLNLNKTKNTTYQLSERQKLYLESLKHQLFILDEETKKLSKDNLEKASLLTKKIRSKGVGKALIKKIENYFKSIGCEYVMVDVFGYNDLAQKFYFKQGYHTRMIRAIKKI